MYWTEHVKRNIKNVYIACNGNITFWNIMHVTLIDHI